MKPNCDQILFMLQSYDSWKAAHDVQKAAYDKFLRLSSEVLGEACPLASPEGNPYSGKRHLFSTLFVLTISALGVSRDKLELYALVIQCMRAQVTGCDNILDDEYKSVLPFCLPGDGIRFRSVLTIMTADAVLAVALANEMKAGRVSPEWAARLPGAILGALMPSGIEEHEEESGVLPQLLSPNDVVADVHKRKTGLLLQAPFRVVQQMGDVAGPDVEPYLDCLMQLGLGCQVLDDIADIKEDIAKQRPNIMVSAAYHGEDSAERQFIQNLLGETPGRAGAPDVEKDLKYAAIFCKSIADEYIAGACASLCQLVPGLGSEEAILLESLIRQLIAEKEAA